MMTISGDDDKKFGPDQEDGAEISKPDSPYFGEDEKVGYGKPPKHTRFPPGKSGNPRGRPKGSRSLADFTKDELDKVRVVTEGGRKKRLQTRQIIVMKTVQKAISGDHKSLLTLANLDGQSQGKQGEPADFEFTQHDQEIVNRHDESVRNGNDSD